LKKFVYILIFTFGLTFTSFSQTPQTSENVSEAILVKFYPNPATSAINFDFARGYNKSYSLLVFNFMGKLVYDVKNMTSKVTIPLTDFYRGIYIFQLRDKNSAILKTGKFQVIK